MAVCPKVKLAETKDLKSFGLGGAIPFTATNFRFLKISVDSIRVVW